MDIFIVTDIFKYHIGRLLYPIDLYNLWTTCRFFLKYLCKGDLIKNMAIQINNELIDIFGTHYDKFKTLMMKSDNSISGSIITRSVVGPKYSDCNIKIHVSGSTSMSDGREWAILAIGMNINTEFVTEDTFYIRVNNKLTIFLSTKNSPDKNARTMYAEKNSSVHCLPLFLEYCDTGYHFDNGTKILSDEELCVILIKYIKKF